jgi:hypothetical protein
VHYVFLIHRDERAEGRSQQAAELIAAIGHGARLLGKHPLHAGHAATTVRGTGSGLVVTDGPFAETGAPLSQLWIAELRDLDDALVVAKTIARSSAGVEIRPVRQAE